MRRVVFPPLDFNDVAHIQWDNYIESKVNHLHEEKVKPPRKRVRRSELPMQRQEDALLLYLRTHGY